jgi:hypothetical protein
VSGGRQENLAADAVLKNPARVPFPADIADSCNRNGSGRTLMSSKPKGSSGWSLPPTDAAETENWRVRGL